MRSQHFVQLLPLDWLPVFLHYEMKNSYYEKGRTYRSTAMNLFPDASGAKITTLAPIPDFVIKPSSFQRPPSKYTADMREKLQRLLDCVVSGKHSNSFPIRWSARDVPFSIVWSMVRLMRLRPGVTSPWHQLPLSLPEIKEAMFEYRFWRHLFQRIFDDVKRNGVFIHRQSATSYGIYLN